MRVPWTILHFEELESTSDKAREIALNGTTPLPFVVRCDVQTRGRGRGQSVWYSDRGSLTFTIAFPPAEFGLSPEQAIAIGLSASVCLIELCKWYTSRSLLIRWPNDVESGSRKLAGLLPEWISIAGGRDAVILVGVGLNVTTQTHELPEHVRGLAVSLQALASSESQIAINDHTSEHILSQFLETFPSVIQELARGAPELASRWARFDGLKNQPVRVDFGDGDLLQGIGAGIDAQGRLLVRNENGLRPIVGGRVLRV